MDAFGRSLLPTLQPGFEQGQAKVLLNGELFQLLRQKSRLSLRVLGHIDGEAVDRPDDKGTPAHTLPSGAHGLYLAGNIQGMHVNEGIHHAKRQAGILVRLV